MVPNGKLGQFAQFAPDVKDIGFGASTGAGLGSELFVELISNNINLE